MFSKKQAIHLIKIAIYHSILFLAYSFIHPRFNTSNFYYFPLAIFIYNIFDFSFTKIKKHKKSEVHTEDEETFSLSVKLFICLCFLIYCMSDIFLAQKSSTKDLRAALDIIFVCLIVLGPRMFFYEGYKSSFLIKSSEGDGSYTTCLSMKQFLVLTLVGFIEFLILLTIMKPTTRFFIIQCFPIPVLMLAWRLFSFDFIFIKTLKDSVNKIAVLVLIYSCYTLFSFGLTSFLIFSNFERLLDLNLMVVTIILYTFTELILDYFRDPPKESEFTEKPTESDRLAMADADHKNSIIQNMTDKVVECINCNFSIKNPSTNLCPNCGSDIYLKSEYISCESCGSDYDHSALSCPYCGHIPSL